jgi:hypothetical protein
LLFLAAPFFLSCVCSKIEKMMIEQDTRHEGPLKFPTPSRVRPQMDAALFGDIDMRVQIPASKANLLASQHRDLIDSIQQETGVSISSLKEETS